MRTANRCFIVETENQVEMKVALTRPTNKNELPEVTITIWDGKTGLTPYARLSIYAARCLASMLRDMI